MRSKINFDETFSLILGREAVQKIKPHPEIHHLIMDTLHVSADECLVIEDSLVGLEAAKCAGIDTIIVYDTYSKEDAHVLKEEALGYFNDFRLLLQWFKKDF